MEATEVVTIKKFLISSLSENKKLLNVTRQDLYDFAEVIGDRTLLMRFLKKHKHDLSAASISLINHLDWRIENRIAELSLNSKEVDTKLLENGIFTFTLDNQKRPVAFIRPGLFIPNSTKDVEDMKNSLIFMLEILRRWIFSIDIERGFPSDVLTQALLVVDLKDFGVSNMVQ
jgi:hypothetical protein